MLRLVCGQRKNRKRNKDFGKNAKNNYSVIWQCVSFNNLLCMIALTKGCSLNRTAVLERSETSVANTLVGKLVFSVLLFTTFGAIKNI